MSKLHYLKKPKNTSKENDQKQKTNLFSKHFNKIYPIGVHRTFSPLSLSSNLSQNSTDSSPTDSSTTFDQKILSALRLIVPVQRREPPPAKTAAKTCSDDASDQEEGPRRCSWITKNSDEVYIQFHDECWGVPVYDDNEMFELLAMCGLLMDFNWTEILKKRQLLREAFGGFDPTNVSKMGENEITNITSNKDLSLAESRVRCIVDNAKCITKVARECGSFSNYMWDYVGHKPVINRLRHSRNVPLRSPKAEAISKDLVRRGFRFVGPVIVYSFMQAAGMTVDHLVVCFRYGECVGLAERPWRHV